MFFVVVLYCVQLLSEKFLFNLFYFFMSNIDPKQYVCCGGPRLCPTVPEEIFISIVSIFSCAILILNNVFVVVVLYCV